MTPELPPRSPGQWLVMPASKLKTRNGEERNGLAEAGRSIEFDGGTLSFWLLSDHRHR